MQRGHGRPGRGIRIRLERVLQLIVVVGMLVPVSTAHAAQDTQAQAGIFQRVVDFFSGLTDSDEGEWYLDRSLAGFRAYPYVERALQHMAAGRYDSAHALLERARSKAPQDAAIWAISGELEIRRGNFALAEQHLARALEIDPELAQAHYYRALVRLENGDFADAEEDFTYALGSDRLTPEQRDAATRQLTALASQMNDASPQLDVDAEHTALPLTAPPTTTNEDGPASIRTQTVEQRNQQNPATHTANQTRVGVPGRMPRRTPAPTPTVESLVTLFQTTTAPSARQALGDFAYTLAADRQCMVADTFFGVSYAERGDAALLIARANCYVSAGDADLAIRAFEDARQRADQLDPEQRLYVSRSLAYLYDGRGDHAQASSAWAEVVDLDPVSENQLALGRALLANGDPHGAALVLNRLDHAALSSVSDQASFFSLRASVRAEDDPAGAVEDLKAAIAINEGAELRVRLAVLLQGLGRDDEALAALERAHELMPNNADVTLALAYAYGNGEHTRQAVALFEEALVEPNGNRFVAQEDLAYAHLRLHDDDAAADSFRRVVDNHSRYPQSTPSEREELEGRMYRVRREVEMLERNWYAYGSAVYRSSDINTSGLAQNDRDQSQLGAEVGWFPLRGRIGVARNLGVYARVFESFEPGTFELRDQSTQAGVGLRLKPFEFTDFVVRGERMIAIGDEARNAWLLSAAHSWGVGGDWRPTADNWTVASTYVEAAWIPDDPEFVSGFGELFVGRAFPVARQLALIPHVVSSMRYSEDEFTQNLLVEAGLGLGLRYWFDEDVYTAPRGTVDLQLQYRWYVLEDTDLPLSSDGSFVGRLIITH